MVEEFFLSSKRKAIRISKDKTASNLVGVNLNNFSRIDTDYDEGTDSDSSIQENVTYQALQKIRFPGSMKLTNPMSRDASPDRGEDAVVTAPRQTARKSRIAVGLKAIGFGI